MATNQNITIPEKELPRLASDKAITHIRAVDAAGASVNSTPAQLAAALGIDYSISAEQLIPGEFWLGADGVKKQLYIERFSGVLAGTQGVNRMRLSYSVSSVPVQVLGYCEQGQWTDQYVVPNKYFNVIHWGGYGMSIEFDPSIAGKFFSIAVKYYYK